MANLLSGIDVWIPGVVILMFGYLVSLDSQSTRGVNPIL
jgi:hypothetical protein